MYMAPEQAAADPNTDHRADLYALGVVGYEMLVGAPPFYGRTPQALLAAQLTETPKPISSRRYDVPRALADLLMRMMEKDPAKRPRTAQEVARLLDDPSVMSGEFTSLKPAVSSRATGGGAPVVGVVAVLLAAGLAAGTYFRTREATNATIAATAAASTASKSIAVLPLVNIGGDTSDVYFAEGMTAQITTALSKLRGLRVAARTAATSARDKLTTPEEIGKSLNVTMLLEGTVQRESGRLRVTARLINIADGATLWSDMFERQATDLFKVQDEISNAIVDAVSPELGANVALAGSSGRARGTVDLQAYDLYLRGRFFFRNAARTLFAVPSRTSSRRRLAIRLSPKRTQVSPTCTPCFRYTPTSAWTQFCHSVFAVSTKPSRSTAPCLKHMRRGRIAGCGLALERSGARLPARALARPELCNCSSVVRRDVAPQWPSRRGARAASARHQARSAIAGCVWLVRNRARHRQAGSAGAGRGRDALDLDSTLLVTRMMSGTVHLYANRVDEAIRQLEGARQLDTSNAFALGVLGYAYGKSGRVAKARDIAQRLEAAALKQSSAAGAAARVYLGLADTAHALTMLERAAAQHDMSFNTEALAEPFFDPIRHSSRFAAVVARVGLDQRGSVGCDVEECQSSIAGWPGDHDFSRGSGAGTGHRAVAALVLLGACTRPRFNQPSASASGPAIAS